MNGNPIERAFELARSGECRTRNELKARLLRERYDSVDTHLAGKLIRTQLSALMKAHEQQHGPREGTSAGVRQI